MFPEKTLPQMLREQAQLRPDKVAIRQKDFGIWKPITWKQYFERACDVGLGLRQLGLREGGHLAVISENRVEWVLAQLGAGLTGAVTVGVYPTSPANEVAYVIGHSDTEIVVCEDQEQVDKVLERRDELRKLRHVVVMETKGARSYPSDFVTTFERLEALGRDARLSHPDLIDETLRGPESRRHRARHLYLRLHRKAERRDAELPEPARAGDRGVRAHRTHRPTRRHLSYLPLCHVAEQMLTTMAPLYLGSQVNFGETIRTVQEDLREVAPTMFLGVPRIWEKLHSAIHIKLTEAGGLRMKLFERGFAACAPFAERPTRRSFAREDGFRLLVSRWSFARCRTSSGFAR